MNRPDEDHSAEFLWCVNVLGPDDLVAFESRAEAVKWATQMNAIFWAKEFNRNDPIMNFIVTQWPGKAEGHAENLARGDARFG